MALLESVFSAMVRPAKLDAHPVYQYKIHGPDASGGFVVSDGIRSEAVTTADDHLFQIDKAITLALQRARPELFFLHAAALAVNGRVVVLPASPGTGKSTLALAQRDLEYLSDELAPVDLVNLTVVPSIEAMRATRVRIVHDDAVTVVDDSEWCSPWAVDNVRQPKKPSDGPTLPWYRPSDAGARTRIGWPCSRGDNVHRISWRITTSGSTLSSPVRCLGS